MAREFEAADLRRKDEYDRDVTLAWMAVAIYGMTMSRKRMPELKGLLSERRDRDKSDTEDMAAKLYTLSKLTGFPLKVLPKQETWPIH